jgi:NTP pyrophosphatase (non-canonical NTP hydrolase)
MEFEEMQENVHDWAESKGWNDPAIIDPDADPTPIEIRLAAIALIHQVLSNELELIRKGEPTSGFLDSLVVSLPAVERVEGINAIKVLAKLALVHSEVSEATGAVLAKQIKTIVLDGKPEGLGSEIVDTLIRLLHLSAMLGHDSAKDFALKMEFNESRPVKHGKLA